MDGIISFLIFVGIVIGIMGKVKKAIKNVSDDDDNEMKRAYDEVMQRRRASQMQTPQGEAMHDTVQLHNQQSAVSTEGQSSYRNTPMHTMTSTITAHSATVHTAQAEETDCDAHTRPISTEGSSIRAHSAQTHPEANTCSAHEATVSTEGETREQRYDRLRKKKAELDAQKARAEREKKAIDSINRTARKSTRNPIASGIRFDKKAVVQAMVYSEVLGKPKSRRY